MQETSNLRPEVERKLMDAVERMPAFPKSVQKVLELSRNINCPPRELVGVIEKDPVMTVKILRVINSAYYSLPKKITSVNQSVVYLGMNTIKNLALAFAAVGVLERSNSADFDIQQYLMHSLSTAAIARRLGTVVDDDVDAGDVYIAGLLHDFGKVVFAQFMPKEYRESLQLAAADSVALDTAETQVIGADHALVGAMLAEKWQFPGELVRCIRHHHDPFAEPSGMLDCLRTANQVSRQQQIGDARNPWCEGEQLATQRFGSELEAVLATIGNLPHLVEEARAFATVGSS
jgi:putative nucleotidyltransferase with HDIG domain